MTTFTTPRPAVTHKTATPYNVSATAAQKDTLRHAIDHRILSSVGLSLAVGIVLGALIGAVIGTAAMGIVIASWPTTVGAAQVLGPVVGWFTIIGALFGAIGSVMRTLESPESVPASD
jgi:predicted lipid-binding transport protein (Tim44 family)